MRGALYLLLGAVARGLLTTGMTRSAHLIKSSRAVDPAIHEPVTNFMKGGWGRRRVARQSRDHLMRPVQILFSRRRPVDLRVKQ
jgi:hypothetical protein